MSAVVNVKARVPYDVYIGRANRSYHLPASKWHNPYLMGVDGDRDEVIAKYEAYIRSKPELMAALPELDGKVLGCWCPPEACHGDVLIRLVDEVCHPRLPLDEAEVTARELVALLTPWCERIAIAGSIRRRKPAVKDIELVLAPRMETVARDLFGQVSEVRDLLHDGLAAMLDRGEITHRPDRNGRPAFGPSTKRIRWNGVSVDVFGVLPPAQWGVILAIRTGSADFATRFMTAKRIGGVLPDDMLVRSGQLFRSIDGTAIPVDREARRAFPRSQLQLIPTPEEADFFTAIGLPWVAPEERV